MKDILSYLGEHWIAVAALVVAGLGWMTSCLTRRDTNKIKLAEKRAELGQHLTNSQLLLAASVAELLAIRTALAKHIPNTNELFGELDRYVRETRNLQQAILSVHRDFVEKRQRVSVPEITERVGRVSELLARVADTTKDTEKCKDLAWKILDHVDRERPTTT